MKRVSAKTSKTSIIPGSGNVFADLRLSNAEEKQTKVRLAVTINQIIASASCGFRGTENKSAEDIRSGELPLGWIFRGTPDEFSQRAWPGHRNRNPQGSRKTRS
jgi:hypothetical protein